MSPRISRHQLYRTAGRTASAPLAHRPAKATVGIQHRAPVSPVLTATQLAVLGALIGCAEPVTARDLAVLAGVTHRQCSRALADLRELRLASAAAVPGHGRSRPASVWTAI